MHGFLAKALNPTWRIITGKGCQIDTANSAQHKSSLTVFFNRTPTTQRRDTTLNCAFVHTNVIKPIGVKARSLIYQIFCHVIAPKQLLCRLETQY
jgi:hypothetical protein